MNKILVCLSFLIVAFAASSFSQSYDYKPYKPYNLIEIETTEEEVEDNSTEEKVFESDEGYVQDNEGHNEAEGVEVEEVKGDEVEEQSVTEEPVR